MKKYIYSIITLLLSVIALESCSDDTSSAADHLMVASFYPTIVMNGTEVTIVGNGMSEATSVEFPGGKMAKSIHIIDGSRLTAIAPENIDTEGGPLVVKTENGLAESHQHIRQAQPRLRYFNPAEAIKTYEDLQIEGTDFLLVKQITFGQGEDAVSVEAIDFKRKSNDNITIVVPAEAPIGEYQAITAEFYNGESLILGELNIEKGTAPGGKWVEQENDLYHGGDVVMGGWSGYINTIYADAFANAKIGDRVRVYIKDQTEGWQQGSFKNGSDWGGLTEELGVINLSTEDFEKGYYEMTIDDTTLPLLQNSGLIISGCNYTATKVVLISTVWVSDNQQPQETVLHEEETVMGGWANYIIISKDAFETAKTSHIVRVYIKDQTEGWQQGSFKNGSDWGGLTEELGVINLSTEDFEKGYYEMTIDDTTLPLLQAYGLIISGCNYTSTKVVLIQ